MKKPDPMQLARASLEERFRARLERALSLAVGIPTLAGLTEALREPPLARFFPGELAALYADHVARVVQALIPKAAIRAAVLDRPALVATWPFPDHGVCSREWLATVGLLAAALSFAEATSAAPGAGAGGWPASVRPDDVAAALEATRDPAARLVAAELRAGRLVIVDGRLEPSEDLLATPASAIQPSPDPIATTIERIEWRRAVTEGRIAADGRAVDPALDAALRRWPPLACARVIAVRQQVDADRARAFIPLPASQHARAAVGIVSQGARGPWKGIDGAPGLGEASVIEPPDKLPSLEIVWDGRPSAHQLALFTPEISQAVAVAILNELSEDGLRDWLILHRLAAEQGRSEQFKWRWAWHRERSAYDKRIASRNVTEAEAARDVTRRLWRLKGAEIRRLGTNHLGQTAFLRVGPFGLLDIPAGVKEADGSLERAVLTINPVLYDGARPGDGGAGFALLPDEALLLPGPQLRLATLLTLDMRAARDEGCTVRLRSDGLWDRLGLEVAQRHRWPRADEQLHRALDVLQGAGVIASWTRDADVGPDVPLASRVINIEAPQAMRDQLLFSVPPILPAARQRIPSTGAELVAWRAARGLTQRAAAAALGVNKTTLMRAEGRRAGAVGDALHRALERVEAERAAGRR